MKTIPLTQGKIAIVDDSDYEYLSQWKWHYNSGYAERGKHIHMHRVVLGTSQTVDHINGETLDNRRSNLRPINHSTNAMNMRKHKGASKYKGVSFSNGYWRVQIWKDNKKVFSVMTPNELWGAMIYDLNAPLLFGQYARLNFSAVDSIATP